SMMPVPEMPRQPHATTGSRYPAGSEIPMPDGKAVQFYPLASEPQPLERAAFQSAFSKVIPSVILVEAVFHTRTDKNANAVRVHSSCAIVGGQASEPAESVLMVSFPHGCAEKISTLNALLSCSSNQTGNWQKAAGGDVPGAGHLVSEV